ncbi:MAG TPA: ABC transporter ATP-binding protein [Chthoniobacteraceae bacterium]
MKTVPPVEKTDAPSDADVASQLPPLKFWQLFCRLFSYTAPYRRKRNWLIAQVILRSILLPVAAWATGAIINGPISSGNLTGIAWSVAAFLLLLVVTNYMFFYRQLLALELGEAVVHDLREKLFAHLQRMTMSFYNEWKPGRLISRMSSDVDAVRNGIQSTVFVSAVQLGQMLIVAAMMLYYDWLLFMIVLSIAPIIWWLNKMFTQKIGDAQREVQESFSRVTSALAESVEGIRVTQGFVREDVNADSFRALVADHSRYNMGVARPSAVFIPLLELNSQFFVAVLLLIGGWRVLRPDSLTEVGDIVQFFILANLFFDPIRTLGTQYTNALMAAVSAERIFDMLDTLPDWQDADDAVPLPHLQGRVEFKNVSFHYKPGRPVLHEINFIAEPGQTIALVGATGSGKSSITNLLTKMYLPASGEIYIDDLEVRRIRSESLHRQMGIVHQQSFLFEGTVLDNIRFARPSASTEEILAAAAKLDYLELIEQLPKGFHTEITEGGANLSSGQRQLISFTRALLADPRILILDEATSAVDAHTEARIQQSMATLLRNRTSFVVAHRLSTIRMADVILVLDHGRIVERGSHETLLALRRIYHSLNNTAAPV